MDKKECKIRKELVELQHKLQMEELAYARETVRVRYGREKENIRIKTAEIRKSQLRRGSYGGG